MSLSHPFSRLYFVPKSWHITRTLSSWAGQALSLSAPKAEGDSEGTHGMDFDGGPMGCKHSNVIAVIVMQRRCL